MTHERISFDRELCRGIISYDEALGRWWLRQSSNPSHRRAYRKIAEFLGDSFERPPRTIVEYACGSGNLLARLLKRFPRARLFGLDGSALLLSLARRRPYMNRVILAETPLPNFGLPRAFADLVVYVFPNMVASSVGDMAGLVHRMKPRDLKAARRLAEDSDSESTRSHDDPDSVCAALIRERLVSLNIHGLLKPGGIAVRVEYGNVPREQLPRLESMRLGFEEGSLDQEIYGFETDQWFRVVASRYRRSRVIEDVRHQTPKSGERGGYLMTVLRALRVPRIIRF